MWIQDSDPGEEAGPDQKFEKKQLCVHHHSCPKSVFPFSVYVGMTLGQMSATTMEYSCSRYDAVRLIDMPHLRQVMPVTMEDFTAHVTESSQSAARKLQTQWVKECCEIIDAQQDNIESLMPQDDEVCDTRRSCEPSVRYLEIPSGGMVTLGIMVTQSTHLL